MAHLQNKRANEVGLALSGVTYLQSSELHIVLVVDFILRFQAYYVGHTLEVY